MAIVACGGGGKPSSSVGVDTLVKAALDAMANAQSFHSEAFVPGDEANFLWQIDYMAPDSYRFISRYQTGDSFQSCYVLPPQTSGTPEENEQCTPEGEDNITSEGVYETIYFGDKEYNRRCDEVDTGCDAWTSGERPAFVLAGPSPTYDPRWPLVALELAATTSSAGQHSGVIDLQGKVNPLRAIFENQRRVATAAGITSFGTVCTSHAVAIVGDKTPVKTTIAIGTNVVGSTPVGLEDCHEQTFEEMLADQEPDVSLNDEHPATISASIDATTHLIRRIALTGLSAHDPDGSGVQTLVIEYTNFNNVTFEAPE
jgi:hypothetical protein